MKSVVAEASSIAKAIELAWQKAGQPKEFLIKVFQEPQRNMFGLTKTSAKVGIFFDDAAMVQKIKHAVQSTIPAGHSTTPINASKQITPIKPIQGKNNAPKPQQPAKAPKQQTPKLENVNKANPVKTQTTNQARSNQIPQNTPASQVNMPTIDSEIVKIETPVAMPQVNSENSNQQATQNNQTAHVTKPKRRYYHRRKSKTPRPNGEQASAPVNKGDN